MKTLSGDNATLMINFVMARTFLTEAKTEIQAMTAKEFNFGKYCVNGLVNETFGPYNAVITNKTKNAALNGIESSLNLVESEIAILEGEYENEVNSAIEINETSETDLLKMFLGE